MKFLDGLSEDIGKDLLEQLRVKNSSGEA